MWIGFGALRLEGGNLATEHHHNSQSVQLRVWGVGYRRWGLSSVASGRLGSARFLQKAGTPETVLYSHGLGFSVWV